MTKITLEEYENLFIEAKIFVKDNPDVRLGQALFNKTYEKYPKLAESVLGTDNDCFYQDKFIDNFKKAIT